MKTREGVICEVLVFFPNLVFCSNMSNNSAFEGVTGGIDTKFIMKALTSKVKRIFRAELGQFYERVEQSFEHPRIPSIGRRRERLPRRGVRVEEEEYDGGGFEGEIDHDSIVGDRRYRGRLRETRNWEGNNLGNIKKKIPSFSRHILSGRRRWSWFLIVTIIPKIRRLNLLS